MIGAPLDEGRPNFAAEASAPVTDGFIVCPDVSFCHFAPGDAAVCVNRVVTKRDEPVLDPWGLPAAGVEVLVVCAGEVVGCAGEEGVDECADETFCKNF